MTGLAPLLLLWLWSRGTFGKAETPPQWPTAASPPPMPAFRPQPTPAAPSAETGTPLADLHLNVPETPQPIPTARKPAATAANKVKAAAAKKLKTIYMPLQTIFARAPAQRTAAVSDLQTMLIARGVKLKKDGLYGPKTAAAWSTLARSKKLPPTIARVGPKVARVVSQTFDVLKLPAIP